jgi:hypothetical protein
MTHLNLASIGRSFLAILTGFATMAAMVGVVNAAITRFYPQFAIHQGKPRQPYLRLNLFYSVGFAALGGFVTASIAKADPLRHILVLAVVVLLLSALSALQLRGQQPVSYQFALIVFTPIGIVAGGLLRMHQAGYRW